MTHLEAEIARTEYELERARTFVNLTLTAIRGGASWWTDEYLAALKEVVRLERTGYCLAPKNPAFTPERPLL